MSGFNFDDFPEDKNAPKFDFEAHPEAKEEGSQERTIDSAIRNFVQAGTAGFSDEISGLVEGAGKAVGLKGLGAGPISEIEVDDDGPSLDWEILKDAYKRARDRERRMLKKDMKENPGASVAGMVGGAITSPLNKLMPGASATKSGIAMGAAGGLGASDSEDALGMAGDTVLGATLGGALGYGFDKINPIVKKGANFISDQMQEASMKLQKTPVENLDEIMAASQRLGVEPIEAIKTSNPSVQKLESGLAQSGSFPAMSVREQYNQFFKGLEKAGDKIADMQSPESDFALGSVIKGELSGQINKAKEPISEMYNNVVPHLQKIPVNQNVVNRVFGQLKKQPIFQTKEGQAFLNEHKDILLSQPELASLKEYRSTLKSLVNDNSLPIDQMRVEELRKAVTAVRDNSIEFMKSDLPKNMHGEVDDLINQIALADSAHASSLNDINSIKALVGNKPVGSPTTFLNKLGSIDDETLTKRASSLDIQSLRNMKDKFPQIFEKAKQAKINDMVHRAGKSKNFESGFFKQYNEMDEELKELIFSPEMRSHIKDLQTVKGAVPEKLGPSGTPEGQMTMDMFNPKRNIQDFLIKQSIGRPEVGESLLKNAATAAQKAGQSVEPGGVVFETQRKPLQLVPRVFENGPAQLPRAAEQNDDSAKNFNKSMDKGALLQKVQGSKYSQVLENAAQKGDHSLAAAHYVLSQRDPEFRKIVGE